MKNILIFILGLCALAASAQLEKELTQPEKVVTVKDSTFRQDSRLNYMVTTILPAVEKFMSEELARQKIAGSVTYEQETVKLYQDLQQATFAYAQNFVVINEVQVSPDQIVNEFQELNNKIEQLQSDPDIRHIEFMQEFKSIRERQEKLANYYNQIEANKPKYAKWKQPLGAHDAYNKLDRVLWNGKVWETTINANVWAPNVTGWREIIE